MKRMEELIHLNKKINFEGKVTKVNCSLFLSALLTFCCASNSSADWLSLQIFPLISQSRWLVKHGELLEVDTQTMSISGSKLKLPTRPVYLHLFNDCLLLSRRKE